MLDLLKRAIEVMTQDVVDGNVTAEAKQSHTQAILNLTQAAAVLSQPQVNELMCNEGGADRIGDLGDK